MTTRVTAARELRWKPGQTQPHVPAGPLLDEVRRRGGNAVVLQGRPDRQRVERALHRGQSNGWVTVESADRLATDVLGAHPADLWGSDWWAVA